MDSNRYLCFFLGFWVVLLTWAGFSPSQQGLGWVHSLLTGHLGAGGSSVASAGMTYLHSTCILDASPGESGMFPQRGAKMSPRCASPRCVPQQRQTTWLSAQRGWALRVTQLSPGTRPLWHQDQLAAGLGCVRRWERERRRRRDGEQTLMASTAPTNGLTFQ